MDVENLWLQRLAFVSVLLVAGSSLPADEPAATAEPVEASAGHGAFFAGADSTPVGEVARVLGASGFESRFVTTRYDSGGHVADAGAQVAAPCSGWLLKGPWGAAGADRTPVGMDLRF